MATLKEIVVIIISGIRLTKTSEAHMFLKNIPRVVSKKNLIGLSQVMYWKTMGISAIGEIKPDKSTAGIWKAVTPKIACCCVFETDEIKSPIPTKASKDIKIDTKNKIKEPLNGTWKNCVTINVIIQVRTIAIHKGGTVLPTRISKDVKGLTISWSKVPDSFSLAIDNAVKRSVITNESIVTMICRIYHLYSKFSLYQFLMTKFIPAPLLEDISCEKVAIIDEA